MSHRDLAAGCAGAVFLAALLATTAASAAAQRAYTLVCRGGGAMRAEYVAAVVPSLAINFGRASSAASREEPRAGQCAWVDRPLNAREPTRMVFRKRGQAVWSFEIRPTTMRVGRYFEDADDLRYLIGGLQSERIFYVQARTRQNSDGHRYLEIVRVGL